VLEVKKQSRSVYNY